MSGTLDEAMAHFEKDLGMPEGFIADLKNQDDWSFVIKSHALLEAALTQLIAHHVGRSELKPILARIDMSNAQFGKAAIGGALGFLTKPERRFIRALSELRNDLVHDIRNVNFDLGAHINTAAEDAKDASALVRTWVLVVEDDPMGYTFQGEARDWRTEFCGRPKELIWQSLRYFLAMAYVVHFRKGTQGGTLSELLGLAAAETQ